LLHFIIPKEPVCKEKTGSLAPPFIKSIHAVNTASSPLLGGDAGVRPEAQEAEGVNSIHAMTASSLPLGGVRGGFFSVPLPHGISRCPSKKQKDDITFESE
jgi:hypothetical protein